MAEESKVIVLSNRAGRGSPTSAHWLQVSCPPQQFSILLLALFPGCPSCATRAPQGLWQEVSAIPYHWMSTHVQAALHRDLDRLEEGANWSPCEVTLGNEICVAVAREVKKEHSCPLSSGSASLDGEMPVHYHHGYQSTC